MERSCSALIIVILINLIFSTDHLGQTNESEKRSSRSLISPRADKAGGNPDGTRSDDNLTALERARTLNNRGADLAAKNLLSDAANVLKESVNLAPELAGAHINLSIVYERKGRLDDSLRSAEIGTSLAPESPRSYRQLCGLYYQVGKFEDAVNCYQTLVRLDPGDTDARAQLGTTMVRTGSIVPGLELLQKVVKSLPMHARAHNSIGFALFTKKKYDAAAGAFKRAVEINPGSTVYRFNLGVAQAMNNNKAGALSQYRFLSEQDPERARMIYQLIHRDKLVFVQPDGQL